MSMLMAIDNGYQACIMAPTEVLAQQHYAGVQKTIAGSGIRTALLTGSTKAKERREIHQGLLALSLAVIATVRFTTLQT